MFLIWNCLNDLLGFSHFLLKNGRPIKWSINAIFAVSTVNVCIFSIEVEFDEYLVGLIIEVKIPI